MRNNPRVCKRGTRRINAINLPQVDIIKGGRFIRVRQRERVPKDVSPSQIEETSFVKGGGLVFFDRSENFNKK